MKRSNCKMHPLIKLVDNISTIMMSMWLLVLNEQYDIISPSSVMLIAMTLSLVIMLLESYMMINSIIDFNTPTILRSIKSAMTFTLAIMSVLYYFLS